MTSEILIGIDYGEANIGIAFARNGLAAPIKIISGKNSDTAAHEILKTAHQNKCTKIIVGLPLTSDGRETKESIKIRQFVKLLRVYLKMPIEFQNEYASSKEAHEEALRNAVSQKNRRKIDHLSAALILKRYIEEHESNTYGTNGN